MSYYDESIPQLQKMLRNLEGWLDEAVEYAEERGFDPEVYVESRLAPNMFPLRRQIPSACDAAKFIAARLAGQDAPKKVDDESTLAELRERITWTLDYLDGFSPDDLAGAGDRTLSLPFLPEGTTVRADTLR